MTHKFYSPVPSKHDLLQFPIWIAFSLASVWVLGWLYRHFLERHDYSVWASFDLGWFGFSAMYLLGTVAAITAAIAARRPRVCVTPETIEYFERGTRKRRSLPLAELVGVRTQDPYTLVLRTRDGEERLLELTGLPQKELERLKNLLGEASEDGGAAAAVG